jgi:hypothetical protein
VAGNFRTRVNYGAIQESFTDKGMIAPDIRKVMNTHYDLAKKFAPYRTGRLRREHYKWMGMVMPYGRVYYVGTRAPYAIYLLGTKANGTGLILPKKGKELEIRPIPYSWFRIDNPDRFRASVHGQPRHESADWLKEAGRSAFIGWRLMRG